MGRGSYISSLNVFVACSRLCRHCRKFGRGRLSLVAISYWRSVAKNFSLPPPRFARSTILEEKWGTTRSLGVLGWLPLFDGGAYNRNRDKADLFQIRFEFTA